MLRSKIDLNKIHLNGYIKQLSGTWTIMVTPELAKNWLKYNQSNRPLSDSHIEALSKRMQSQDWKLNGQCIIFSRKGVLHDGQHRLHAVLKYGDAVWFDVRFGVSEDTFDTLDDGRKRSPRDVLAIHNIPNYSNTASAVKKIIDFKNNQFGRSRNTGRQSVSNKEVVDWYYDHPEISEIVLLAMKWYDISGKILPPADFACYFYLMSKSDEKKAEEFFNKLALGANLSVNSPIFKLRAKLMQSKMDRQKTISPKVKQAIIIKAWNYYIKDASVKILKFDTVNEQFPSIE